MPTPLAPVTLTAGTAQTVNLGSQGSVGAVVIGNESPYAIMASAGSGGIWVLAQMADRLNCDTTAFNGNITLTAQNYLSNSNQAPSFQVYLTVYAPGEPIPGTYPCALSRMFNVGNGFVSNSPANVFEQDLFTPFVYSGYVATKDGSVSNQLDVTSGIAFLRQPTDSSLLRIANSSNTFLTTTPTSTYFLDLNPDGSWSWATSHSGVTNHLTIASATTDGSGNISAVTDARALIPTLLSAGDSGDVALSSATVANGASGLYFGAGLGAGMFVQSWLRGLSSPFNGVDLITPLGGALTTVIRFITSLSGATKVPFAVGDVAQATTGALTQIAGDGRFVMVAGQAAVGSFGVPVIVAQALNTAVTTTGDQVILTFTPPAVGLYRLSGGYTFSNGSATTITFRATFYDPNSAATVTNWFIGGNASVVFLNATSFGAGTTTSIIAPLTFYAGTNANIIVHWNDSAGTPNDHVSVVLERLA